MHSPDLPLIPLETLLLAYRSGIFPMSDDREDAEVFWVEPQHRAIFPLDQFHMSRSLAKILRRDHFRVTCNANFDGVVAACAQPRADHPETWISHRIAASYRALHDIGHAHSIECWLGDELVGGLYGVSFDRVFCGESMFSLADNASKVALAWLVALMRRSGFELLDCQFMTEHLASLGAIELPQADYLRLLASASRADSLEPRPLPDAYSALLEESLGVASASSSAGTAGASPGKLIAQSLTQTS